MQIIRIPTKTLIVLVAPSGAGKSTLAAQHFQPTQIVSSDNCRAQICDSPYNQQVNRPAFYLFYRIIQLRLAQGRQTVADSTALEAFARTELLALASEAGYHTCVLALALPLETCRQQNSQREKPVPDEVLIQQHWLMSQSTLRQLRTEPWDQLYIFEEWPQDLQFMRAITRRVRSDGSDDSSIDTASQAG